MIRPLQPPELNRDWVTDDVREATKRIATPREASRATTESAFVFRVGDEWFALPTRVCERAVDEYKVHSLPHRRSGVLLGIGSVEGDLLLTVSFATLLGVSAPPSSSESGRALLLNFKQSRYAAPMDEIHGVHRYHPEDLEPVPTTLRPESSFTAGMLSWQNGTVALLDPERVFDGLRRGVS